MKHSGKRPRLSSRLATFLLASLVFGLAIPAKISQAKTPVEKTSSEKTSRDGGGEFPLRRPKNPGFRTDVGIHLSSGALQCLAGSADHAVCQDFGMDWVPSWGMALGVIIRPGTHISFGMDASIMNMSGRKRASDNWFELAVGPTTRLHLPIRIGRFVIEPAVGVGVGYAEGHLRFRNDESKIMKGSLYGPFVGILCNLQLFVLPGFGFGIDIRIHKMFFREICTMSRGTRFCRGIEDKESQYFSEIAESHSPDYSGELAESSFSWKIYTGGQFVYYF